MAPPPREKASWWQERSGTVSTDATAATAEDLGGDADVVVVGAGITGLTTALLLARAGRSVTVLEGRRAGAGTTGRSTAKVSLLQGTRLSKIATRHGRGTLDAYVRGSLEAQAWVAQFCEEHGVPAQRRPAFTYANGRTGELAVRRELGVLERVGLPAAWEDDPGLPFGTRGAVRLDDQLQVDPVALVAALTQQGRAAGVRLVEGARVTRVRGRDPVEVTTDAGTVRAGTVVSATNLPVLDRGLFFARATPQRSYTVAVRAPGHGLGGMYLSADSPSRSLRDTPDTDPDVLLVGGAGHRTGKAASPQAHADELVAWAQEHYPGSEPLAAWSAQDWMTADVLPWAGPLVPRRDDLLMAGGFGKWGMTGGVAGALLLAGRVTGRPVDWEQAFLPWRGREAAGLPTMALANAEVGLELTRGWIRSVLPGAQVEPPPYDEPAGARGRLSKVCTHLGGRVVWNDLESSWDCPLHGSRFAADGSVLEGPATRPLAGGGAGG